MIAYLEKIKSNAEFRQIVDFLTLSSIHHDFTVSPTIYASNIEHIWNTVTSQTINDEKQIHAIVDGKTLGDSLVRPATTASLDAQHDSSNIAKNQFKTTLNEPTPHGEGSGSGLGCQETMGGAMAQIRSEGAPIQSIDPPLLIGHTVGSGEDMMEHEIELTDPVPQTPYDLPLSGGYTPGSDEGSMTLKELIDLYTTLLQKVLDLENVKTAQDRRLPDADTEMIVEDKHNGEKGGSTAESVSTARPDISATRLEVSTVETKSPPTTTTLFDDEDVTIADTLVGSEEDEKRIGSRKKRAADSSSKQKSPKK
uniref:Xylulose kinase-1 n=1 Tax=Tanacetum cinerariifolium TaxID=118510 RepID=A0A6L2K7Z3_TANCI|nr:hypothetical protein [Tanacetum cinerariifolium]